MVDPATVEGATGTKDGAQRDSGCCVPPALLSELKGKASRASAHSTALPEWGCFRPVVLPTRASSTRTHFEEKLGPPDGSKFGEGRSYRFDVSTRWVGWPPASRDLSLYASPALLSCYGYVWRLNREHADTLLVILP